METRKLRILVTGQDSEHLIKHIAIEEYCRYFLVDKNGKEIIDIDSYQGRRTRNRGNKLLNLSTSDGISVGKEVLGVYDLSISAFSNWDEIPADKIDAVIIAVPSDRTEYVEEYMIHARTYNKLLFVIVHTRFDYSSGEQVKDDMVKKLLEKVKQARDEQEREDGFSRRIYTVCPAHIFVDLDYNKQFPYKEYLTKIDFQNMLHTIWVLRPNKPIRNACRT